eukprot:TRINITY_DN50717_c0_g1_i1.p1 TRINITY_DN50717_c0_g1~~TRINITY_DN50717_c0_g1_i1.p1  ORF type:complete len:1004 (+),score=228.82 TRINITY_DN50717_c0_g1_i1:64-3012(+)
MDSTICLGTELNTNLEFLPALLKVPELIRAKSAPACYAHSVTCKMAPVAVDHWRPASIKLIPTYMTDLFQRSLQRARKRQSHLAIIRLQRAMRNFFRQKRRQHAAIRMQKHARGFLQRLRAMCIGQNILFARRAQRVQKASHDATSFMRQQRSCVEQRASLRALASVVPHSDRDAVLNKLLELEYKRNQLTGLQAVKDFLAHLRADMMSRVAFGEEVQVAPLLLIGPPGSGKRLTAKLVHEELSAMKICRGPFTETQSWEELKEAFKNGKDGLVSNVVYISGMDDKDDIKWSRVIKRTEKALPKALLIFGLNDSGAMDKIHGSFIRSEPLRLMLPALMPEELAQIVQCSLEERGYLLQESNISEMLVRVINEQWTRSDIAHRNGHLAKITIERAIQNKNRRHPPRFGAGTNPAILLPEDFGITELSKQKLQQSKARVIEELDQMPGFKKAKEFLHGVRRRVEFVESGGNLSVLETCMNLVLTGNPGSGKTTFARLLFRLLRAHGVLKKDAFVELNALELKGKHVGHTAPKVKDAIRSALGGALFLDEAYALCKKSGGKDCFSDEAVHTLLTEVENNRTGVLVILAGYEDRMGQFLAQDPGLARRFPLRLNLPDYSPEELSQIAEKVARERFDLNLEAGLVRSLQRHIEEEHRNEIRCQNASLAVTLVEQAVEKMTCRLIENGKSPHDGGSELLAADFGIQSRTEDLMRQLQEKVQEELNAIVGMEEPKQHLLQLKMKIDFVRLGGNPKVLDTCMNLVLTGNPGTGKTTFARLLFKFLRAHGVLKKDVFIERNALELKGEYCGQTAPKIKDIFEMAVGGCLFLDEAYALANGDKFSNEAIRMLLTEVESHRTDVLVILAGYDDKMAELLQADPGLARRFPQKLKLPDYSAEDIACIARSYAKHHMETPFAEGVEEALAAWLAPKMKSLDASKHNGGLAVQLTEAALGRLAMRVTTSAEGQCAGQKQEYLLTPEDFGIQSHTPK